MRSNAKAIISAASILVLTGASMSHGAVDTMKLLFKAGPLGDGGASTGNGLANGAQIQGYDFDPVNNRLYIVGTSTAQLTPPTGMYRIDNFEQSNQQPSILAVDPAQYSLYLTGGVGTPYSGQPVPSGLRLNPVQLGSGGSALPAYGTAFITELQQARISQSPEPTLYFNEVTKRLYKWNLQQATVGEINAVHDVVNTVGTLKSYLAVAGANQGISESTYDIDRANRNFTPAQGAFGYDGKSFFHTANSSAVPTGANPAPAVGGLWRVDTTTNTLEHVLPDTAMSSIIAVKQVTANGDGTSRVDRVFFGATASTGNILETQTNATPPATGKFGGANYIDYDYQTNSIVGQGSLVTAERLKEFVRGENGQNYSVDSVQIDEEGNYYIRVSGGSSANGGRRNVVLRLEAGTNDKLSKVLTYDERRASFVDVNTLVAQPNVRTVGYTGAGGTFDVPQFTWAYSVNTGKSYVGGAYVFKPGDFNRDNQVDQLDAAMLASPGVLKTVRSTTTDQALFKFDMNGDADVSTTAPSPTSVVDFHDVKTFQQFYDFVDGDTNIDQSLDVEDLNRIRDGYLSTAATWTGGDFTGDNTVDLDDLLIVANSWLVELGQANFTMDDLDGLGYSGQFRMDLQYAFAIPEPASMAVIGTFAAVALRRRRVSKGSAR